MRFNAGSFAALGLFALIASCGFKPQPADGTLPCNEGCPGGYVCRTDNRCYRAGAGALDSGMDGAKVSPDTVATEAGGIDAAGASLDGFAADQSQTTDATSDQAADVPLPGIDTGLDAGAGGNLGGAGGKGGAGGGAGSGGAGGGVVVAPVDGAMDSSGDASLDAPVVACGAAGQICCAGNACTSGCCVSNQCVANGATCATGGTCAAGLCSSAASLLASTASLGLGSVVTGQPSTVATFTLTNSGQQPSGAITLTSSSAEFAIQTGATSDCVSGTTTLAANASCTVRVVLTPSAAGARSGLITYSATPGGNGSVSASGAGITPGSLASSVATLPFGTVALGSSSAVASFTITNTGQAPSGVIALAASSAEFVIQTGVTGDCVSGVTTLAASASCTVRVVYTPAAVASRSENITFSATPGGSGSVGVTGTCVLPSCTLGTAKLGACKLGL